MKLMPEIRRRQINAAKMVDEDRHYYCRQCTIRYAAKDVMIDLENGRQVAWWCPKKHPVKLIPMTSMPCPLCGYKVEKFGPGSELRMIREEGMPCHNCMIECQRTKTALAEYEGKMQSLERRSVPVIRLPSYGWSEDRKKIGLNDAFEKIVLLMGHPTVGVSSYNVPYLFKTNGERYSQPVLLFTSDQISALECLYRAIEATAAAAEKDGRENGEAFIRQLAAGEISMKDLAEHDEKAD